MGFEAFIPVLVALITSCFPLYVSIREAGFKRQMSNVEAEAKKDKEERDQLKFNIDHVYQMLRTQVEEKDEEIGVLRERFFALEERVVKQREVLEKKIDEQRVLIENLQMEVFKKDLELQKLRMQLGH